MYKNNLFYLKKQTFRLVSCENNRALQVQAVQKYCLVSGFPTKRCRYFTSPPQLL